MKATAWSPDDDTLLVVRRNWTWDPGANEMAASGLVEIWQVQVQENQVGEPALLFWPSTQSHPVNTLVHVGAVPTDGRRRRKSPGLVERQTLLPAQLWGQEEEAHTVIHTTWRFMDDKGEPWVGMLLVARVAEQPQRLLAYLHAEWER